MSADAIDVRNRLVGQAKESLKDNATVIISSLGVLIAAFGLLFGGVAMYGTFSLSGEVEGLEDEIRLSELYLQDLVVEMQKADIKIPERRK